MVDHPAMRVSVSIPAKPARTFDASNRRRPAFSTRILLTIRAMSELSLRSSEREHFHSMHSAHSKINHPDKPMKITLMLSALLLSASFAPAADKSDKANPEAIFKKLDSNNDGSVTKEEYLASKRAQKDTDKAGKRFEKLDANKDGKLSKEEMSAGEKAKKGAAPAAPAAPAKPDEKKPDSKK
jgi:Ca2+-binding EF-hand superfamily protein